MDGALAMKQIYDDLGIYKDLSWHRRSDDDNVAHNWNDGESMSTIFRKLLDGSGEWDTSIADAIKDGSISSDLLKETQDHYNNYSTSSSSIPAINPPPPPKTAEEQNVSGPKTTFLESFVPKTVDKEVKNTWGKVVDTEYTKDISDTFTTELLGDRGKKWGIDAEEAQAIETSFIDDVYGTTDADATTWGEGTRAWDDPTSGYDSTWGLDLRRVYDADLKAGTPAMTDYLTKGPIDYAHYISDPNYKAAFEKLGFNLALEGLTDQRKASMIRQARQEISIDKGGTKEATKTVSDGSGGSWLSRIVNQHKNKKYETDADGNLLEPTEWDGMYDENKIYMSKGDLYIDDIRQKTITDLLKSGEGRYDPTTDDEWQRDKIKKDNYTEREFNDLSSKEYRATLNLPSRESFGLSIRKREGGPPVERPTNIPKSWGKV